jgi:CheY-like chemotaxis protein
VVALTALVMPGDRERCLEAGCDDYDGKPVDFPSLLSKIQALIR